MNRGLVSSLCAAVVAFVAAPALAAVDVQLNLKYTDPNNATGGGTWELLAKSTAGEDVVGLVANIVGDTGVTGVDTGPVSSTGGVWDNVSDIFRYSLLTGGATEIVAGDNLDATVTTFAAGGGKDDLYPSAANSWDGSVLLASGSWTGARPDLTGVAGNVYSAGTSTAASIGTVSVRGDSVGVDGLKLGDADRSGVVNSDDFNLLAVNFGQSGKAWDQGDFDSSGTVNSDDFNFLAVNFGLSSAAPPATAAVGAVPEPGTIALVSLGALGLLACRRKG